jgi:hypothetical protein
LHHVRWHLAEDPAPRREAAASNLSAICVIHFVFSPRQGQRFAELLLGIVTVSREHC